MSDTYLAQLAALQPPGVALPTDADSVWMRLLAALAAGFTRVDARAVDVVREADPRQALAMLPEWERVCGLPGECAVHDAAATLQVRRGAVVNVLTRMGGQTPAFYRRLAEIAGVTVDIHEYRPFVAGASVCGERLNGPHEVRYVWRVTIRGQRITRFRTGASVCGDQLVAFDPAHELACLLRLAAPAHTTLIIGYT